MFRAHLAGSKIRLLMLFRKILIFQVFCLVGSVFYAGSANAGGVSGLPDIGSSSTSILSPGYERQLGQVFLRQLYQHANIADDPEIHEYINAIGYRLVSYSEDNTRDFNFL